MSKRAGRGRVAAAVTLAAAAAISSPCGIACAASWTRAGADVPQAHGSAYRRHGYHGPAGLYSCAPGRVNTYLERKACGGAKFPNRFL